VPIDAKVLGGLIGLALLFVGGGYAAWNMPERKAASRADAASHTFVPPAVQTVQRVVTVRERGRVVRRLVPVVERVVAPGTLVTETRLETATIVADGATQVVTTERIERVPVLERRVVTIGGEVQTIVTTAPGAVRTVTGEGGVTTVVRTVSRPAGTATRVSTVVTTVPSAPRTVTADERVTTDVRTVTTQTPGATITRTVTTDGGVGTVTVQQPGVTSTRTITTVQPTTLVSTVVQTTTQTQTATRTVTTVQPTTVVQTATQTVTTTTPPITVTTTVPTTVTVVVPPKPH